MERKLSNKEIKFLKSIGHSLKASLKIGKFNLSGNFLKQLKSDLEAHELIKIKTLKASSVEMDEVEQILTSQLGCMVVQKIGKTMLLYKPNPEKEGIVLPK